MVREARSRTLNKLDHQTGTLIAFGEYLAQPPASNDCCIELQTRMHKFLSKGIYVFNSDGDMLHSRAIVAYEPRDLRFRCGPLQEYEI